MIEKLLAMPRAYKKVVFLLLDTVLMLLSFYIALSLRYGELLGFGYQSVPWPIFLMMGLTGPMVMTIIGLPRIKLHAIEVDATLRFAFAAGALSLMAIVVSYLLQLTGPRSAPLIFGAVFFLLTVSTRLCVLYILRWLSGSHPSSLPVIIYGAGAAGMQLASALRQSVETRPALFVDDNPNLHDLMIGGLRVCDPVRLPELIKKHNIARVLLAIPSAAETRRDALLQQLTTLGIEVQVLPSFIELMAQKGADDAPRSVTSDELLGRSKVELDTPEIAKAYAGRAVMVTGAGGSIGSELCRQLVNCNPARIILFDHSEYALYAIERELSVFVGGGNIEVVMRLGSVTNRDRVAQVVREDAAEIILHAAAYKHVPIVEDNEIEGAQNNVIGTQIVADVASAADIERFILVSTDKAVRPTSIMGATKRLAELVVQDLQLRVSGTKFAMVRFGNVLGSSGSVLPLFQKQIKQGGPVTVTHSEMTRYFMTIPEAARLVLLAGAYAQGGDVFILDMGEPQRILDIAKRMIGLSGRKVKDPETGEGDIAIEITGLRPGEKLYEELLLSDTLSATPHPKILRAHEAYLSEIEMASILRSLQSAIASGDAEALRVIIANRVDGYHISADTKGNAQAL